MIVINLTQGQVTTVSDEDADLALLKWQAALTKGYGNGGAYTVRRSITRAGGKRAAERMHRVILSRVLGRPLLQSELVDHIDRNPLNNQRDNLRVASSSQNAMNRDKTTGNKSGYKGVSWNKVIGKWNATITINGKKKSIGYFTTKEEAYEVYCKVAKSVQGEFAPLIIEPPGKRDAVGARRQP